MKSRLYTGKVFHKRLSPIEHEFTYPMYACALDLDELQQLHQKVELFGYNRFNVFSVRDKDYLPGREGSIRERVMSILKEQECDDSVEKIELITSPRYFNYSFNPVNFYLCQRRDSSMRAAIAEVNNTFGETHLYVLDNELEGGSPEFVRYRHKKEFHVSPSASYCYLSIRERNLGKSQQPSPRILENISHVFSNRPFVILLISYTVSAFGAALPATLILFYVEDVLGSAQGSAFLMLYFLIGFLCLPLWVRLAGKIGKKEAWIAAMVINTGAFCLVFFLGQGDLLAYGVLVAFSAVGYGATLAIPSSMQADVIDLDELKHGSRKEGQFIGFWAISKKFAAAIGAGLAFLILDAAGYDSTAGAQSESAIFALRFLYAGVPCICSFAAIMIAIRYPITRFEHEDIRRQIDFRAESALRAEAAA